jgi:hypothetical protein
MMRSNCLRWVSSSMCSRAAGSTLSGVGGCAPWQHTSMQPQVIPRGSRCRVRSVDVTGDGNNAAIGWDVVDVRCTVETAVGQTIVSVGLALGKKFGEILQGMKPGLVDVRLHFVLGHLFFGVVVTLVHLTNDAECFGFFQDDDIDVLALLLLFVELTAKSDDVGGRGDPCLMEPLCPIGAPFWHDLAPVCAEVC